MKCIICGKELTRKRKKYCSMKCAQQGFILGKSTHFKDDSKKVSILYDRFSKSFNCHDIRYKCAFHFKNGGLKIRTFIAACLELGYSQQSIAHGIGRDHSTISRHRYRITENELNLAKEFLSNNNYVFEKPSFKEIYPEGFNYGAKK